MKKFVTVLAIGIVCAALALFAQNGNPNPQPGQGRGGAPHAYCDKDGDGLCDVTGAPVGECREAGCPGCDGQCPRNGDGQGQGPGQGQRRGRGGNGGVCPRTGGSPNAGASVRR